jgi:hypothetical protein
MYAGERTATVGHTARMSERERESEERTERERQAAADRQVVPQIDGREERVTSAELLHISRPLALS